MIRVLICDDQWIVCEGLEAILDNVPGLEVVGCACDGAEALEKVARLHPDVVLMDLNMPVMNGVQATQQITAKYPEVKVLVLTTYGADEWVFDALRSGAVGYLLEDAEPPIYIEFRTRHQGTSPEVEARWLALADTLQWSPLSG